MPQPSALAILGLHMAPSDSEGHTLPDVFFKCYQIYPNILNRPLNLTSAMAYTYRHTLCVLNWRKVAA